MELLFCYENLFTFNFDVFQMCFLFFQQVPFHFFLIDSKFVHSFVDETLYFFTSLPTPVPLYLLSSPCFPSLHMFFFFTFVFFDFVYVYCIFIFSNFFLFLKTFFFKNFFYIFTLFFLVLLF